MYATGVNHRTTTPDYGRRTAAEWVGLRQSVRRLAAGQGVLTAMTPCLGTVKACRDADLRQFQEARLCAARGRSQRRAWLIATKCRSKQLLRHASGMTVATTA